jgi:3-dehydroquinate dehydratase
MSNPDYQEQLTQIYNKLAAIQADLSKLALMSNVNTIQTSLQNQMNAITSRIDTLTTDVGTLILTMNDLIIELRSK